MIQALTFLLVATTTASTAMPLFNLQRWAAPVDADAPALVVKRADTPAQLAQGTNFYFESLHLESACTPGQTACVGGNIATCSPEANWEISPCPTDTQCYAIPDSGFVNGINVKCTTQSEAQTAINEAGGDGNVSEYFAVSDAPFIGTVDAEPSPSDAPSDTPTDAPASEEPTPTESAEDPNATCIPDEETGDDQEGDDQDGNIETASEEVPSFTASLGEPVPTEIAPSESVDPAATCTEEPEEPVATETITLILVPNPTESGVYETSTLTGELPAATEPVSDVPVESETASATSEAASVEPTESPSCTESYEETPTETAAPTETSPASEEPIQSESSSVPAEEPASPTTLTIAPGNTSVPVNPGSPPSTTVPDVNVVGNHQIPAVPSQSPGVVKKRMEKKVRRS